MGDARPPCSPCGKGAVTQIGLALEQLHFWEHSSLLCGALSWAVAAVGYVCVCVCVRVCVGVPT